MVEYTDPLHKSKMCIIRFLYNLWSQVEEIDSHWRLHQRIEKQIYTTNINIHFKERENIEQNSLIDIFKGYMKI